MRSFREVSARFHNTQHSFSILRLADAALSAAGRANKDKSSEATEAFLRVKEEIRLLGFPHPQEDRPGDHRKRLPDPITALESASKRDEKSTGPLSRVNTAFNLNPPVSHLS